MRDKTPRQLMGQIRRLIRSGDPDQIREARALSESRGAGPLREEYRYRLREHLDRMLRSRDHQTNLDAARLMKTLDPSLGDWMLDRAEREVLTRLHTRTDHVVERGLELLSAFDHPELWEKLWQGAGHSGVLSRVPWRLGDVRPGMRPVVLEAVLRRLPAAELSAITAIQVSELYQGIPGGPPLPSDVLLRLTGLRELDASRCSADAVPDWVGKLSALTVLKLDQTAITTLPALPAGLETLSLQRCEALETLPAPVGALGSLKHLDLSDCAALSSLPAETLAGLTALETLDLSRCKALEAIPAVLATLPSLRTLSLRGCKALVDLPLSVERKPGLTIDTTGCAGLPRPLARLRSAMLSGVSSVAGMSPPELKKVAAEIRPLLNSAQRAERRLGVAHLQRFDDDDLFALLESTLIKVIRKRGASEAARLVAALDRPSLRAVLGDGEE